MTPEEISRLIKAQWGDAVLAMAVEGSHPHAKVAADSWPAVAEFLRDDPRLRLNFLRCISSIDLLADDKLGCIYDLCHVPPEHPDELKTKTHKARVADFRAGVEDEQRRKDCPALSMLRAAATGEPPKGGGGSIVGGGQVRIGG